MNKQGFIQLIIIIVLLVVILSLLGVSLSALFANPVLRDNFGFLGRWLVFLWDNYLSVPFGYIRSIWGALVWQPFVETMRGFWQGISPFNPPQ